MKPWLLGCTLLVSVAAGAAPLSPESLATAARLRDQALAGSGAYEVVESLTTEVGPRMGGTPADARAVAADESWLWIYRDCRAPGGWFLQGFFS